jgi:hypothetical protein
MPRHAVERKLLIAIVVALSAVQAVACDSDGGDAPDPGPEHPVDAAQDADVEGGGAGGSDAPWDAGPDGSGGGGGLTGEFCALNFAAECDGKEDCPGFRCCGARFELSAVSYTKASCSNDCDFQRVVPLCHAGEFCTAEGDAECRTSIFLPGEFIGICAPPNSLQPNPAGVSEVGLIDCGAQQCVVGEEQCCIREGVKVDVNVVNRFESIPHEPYCAPLGEPCECMGEPPPRDAAMPDADAGAP